MQGKMNTGGSKRGKQSVRRKCYKETVLLQYYYSSDLDRAYDLRPEDFYWFLELEDKTSNIDQNRNWEENEAKEDFYSEFGERRHFSSRPRDLNSLIFFGVPEIENETPEQTEQVIREMLETLKIGKISISNAERIMEQNSAATRPILLLLQSTSDKNKILKAKRILKKSSITVQQGRTEEGRRQYEMLRTFAINYKKKNPSAKYFIRNSKLRMINLGQMATYKVNGNKIL